MGKEYRIEYLPAAQKDLLDTASYIRNKLKAPAAARNFRAKIGKAIEHLSRLPYSCRVYESGKPPDYEVRVLSAENFNIFYVVEEDSVLIHRVLYGKRNMGDQDLTGEGVPEIE